MKRHTIFAASVFVVFTCVSSAAVLTGNLRRPSPGQNSSCKFDLSGHWVDNGRKVTIQQIGCNVVNAFYDNLYPCKGTPGTTVDFKATLSGNTLSGKTSVCNYGTNHQSIELVPIRLTISADGNTLNGTYHNTFDNRDHPVSLTRDCTCDEVSLGIARDYATRELESMTTGSQSNINSLKPDVVRQIGVMRHALCDKAAISKVDNAKNTLNALSASDSPSAQQSKIAQIIGDLNTGGSCGGGTGKGGGSGLCPDVSGVEAAKGQADRAVSIANGGAQIAKLAGDERTQQAFEDTAEALGHITDALEKVISLNKKCELVRDLLNAIDEINRAGCNSSKLARGFDHLFRSGGQIGKNFDIDPVTNGYFDLLSRNENFFENVSSELNPEQRWKRQFQGIDQYVPGGCQ